MSDLLAKLESFQPASLWTMAPKNLLLKGAGLLSVGDVTNLFWSGKNELTVVFPDRLDSITAKISLSGTEIVGTCSCAEPQPCQHFLGSLMLCLHLLKDTSTFGRLPKRLLADRLRLELKGAALEEKSVPEIDLAPIHRYLLVQPGNSTLFRYVDSFFQNESISMVTVPQEVRPFCSLWGTTISQEAMFWQWFIKPGRRLPVCAQNENGLRRLAPSTLSGWEGSAVLDLNQDGICLRRSLLQNKVPVAEPFIPVGEGLVMLPESNSMARLPLVGSWHQWEKIMEVLRPGSFQFYGFPKAAESDGMLIERRIEFEEWNNSKFIWGGANTEAGAFPTLLHNGQPQVPETQEAQACLMISPSTDHRLIIVKVAVEVGGDEIPCSEVLQVENALSEWAPDPGLLSAKSRRAAIMGTVYECWLENDPMKRRELLRELEKAPVFKSGAHRKQAVKMVKEAIKLAEEATTPQLGASPSNGWFIVTNAVASAYKAAAVARRVLDCLWADEVPDYEGEGEMDATLVAYREPNLALLPKLFALCQEHGIRLTYASHPVEILPLQCRVEAAKPEGLDWFEMKPEVRSNGSLIPQEEWERILSNGHVIDSDTGVLRIIDVKSLDGLNRLQHLLGRQRAEQAPRQVKGTTLEDLVKIPRMRVLDWLLLTKYGIECELPASERQVLESLLSFESLERQPVPTTIRATLRDYQVAGYSWLSFLYKHGFGACLADDMGLGKTLQTITMFAAIHDGTLQSLSDTNSAKRPHLLVVPPTLLFNWENEVRTFCPELRVWSYTGKGRSLLGIKEGIVITTYDIARRDIEHLRNVIFDCVVFDEAQSVKNLGGERSRAMRQLQGRFKLVLTGTPMENHVGEYYSIIDLAVPGLFGDYKTFMDAIKQPNGIFNPLDRARPFVLRRTKDKILKELPPKVTSDMHLELSDEQKRFYTRAVGEVRQEVLAAFEDKSAQQAGIVALAALTRLRQICVSPALIDPEHTEISPKLQHLVDKLQELQQEGYCALVFSQFTKALDQLEKHLREGGIEFLRLDGSTPQEKRKKLVESFQSGKGPGVFLISLKAGGAGLNLTRASYVFHLDPWWNPAVENQASDRAHRMGQKSTVFIQRLLMVHTVEEKIMQLKARKSELFDQVLSGTEGDRPQGAVITKEDFKFLLE